MNYPKRGLSIDIGNELIKIIEYQSKKNKVVIKHALSVATPEHSMNDGQIINAGVLVDIISVTLKEHRIKSKNVVFTMASSKIITREVDLPDLPKKKLDTLISMNAEEYFPVNLADYTLDYRIVEKVEENEEVQIRISIIAALTTFLEAYVNLAGALSLKIVGIDYAGNSVVNFAKHLKFEGTYMLLDIGSDSTMVTIMSGNIAKFNRNLAYGTKGINTKIQDHFGVNYEESIKISIEQSLLNHNPEENDHLSSEVSNALNHVLSGISRLVDYYTSRNKEVIDHIYLVGGGTYVNNVAEFIGYYFNIECSIVEEFGGIYSKNEQFINEKLIFANTIGAIFSGMNLLPKTELYKKKNRSTVRVRLEIILLVLLIGAVLIYVPYVQVGELENKKEQLAIEIEAKQVVEAIIVEHTSAMSSVEFGESIMVASGSTTEVVVDVLEEMEKIIPTDVDYLIVNNSEDNMLISCNASNKLSIIQFATTLKEMMVGDELVFAHVYIPSLSSSVEDDGYYSFTITCRYNKGVE